MVIEQKLAKKTGSDNENQQKIGILLANLGTPEATDYFTMRRYLSQFLRDKRVIEKPKWLWYPLLYGIILNKRPQYSGAKYKMIWDKERNESPMRIYSRNQSVKLQQSFDLHNSTKHDIIIEWGMRYGQPSIGEAAQKLLAQNCQHLIFLPLYPQYSASTTASAYDSLFAFLQKQRVIPRCSLLGSYGQEPRYIAAIRDSILEHMARLPFKLDHLLVSFHGIPKSYAQASDPYERECCLSFQLLQQALLEAGACAQSSDISMAYQSRFGPEEWLTPYSEDRIKQLAQKGVKNLAIIAPGFASDCLETLEEIEHDMKAEFLKAGGQNFTYIPCLNDSDRAIALYRFLLEKYALQSTLAQ